VEEAPCVSLSIRTWRYYLLQKYCPYIDIKSTVYTSTFFYFYFFPLSKYYLYIDVNLLSPILYLSLKVFYFIFIIFPLKALSIHWRYSSLSYTIFWYFSLLSPLPPPSRSPPALVARALTSSPLTCWVVTKSSTNRSIYIFRPLVASLNPKP